jgi:hypothetical protein
MVWDLGWELQQEQGLEWERERELMLGWEPELVGVLAWERLIRKGYSQPREPEPR